MNYFDLKKWCFLIVFQMSSLIGLAKTKLSKTLENETVKELHIKKVSIYINFITTPSLLWAIINIKQLENPCRKNIAKAINFLPLLDWEKNLLKKQFFLESGKFRSPLFKKYNNISGMKIAEHRPQVNIGKTASNYAIYEHWTDSIIDRYIQYMFSNNQILLSNYASNPNYLNTLSNVKLSRYDFCYLHKGECK